MLGILLQLDSGEVAYYEYIQAKLVEPLIQDSSYKFSFNVSLANGSDYSIKKIGAWFSNTAVTSNDGSPLFQDLPQVGNELEFLDDTVNWMEIESEFVANGGEEYITIGFFVDSLLPDTSRVHEFAEPTSIFSYYYVDGLDLRKVTDIDDTISTIDFIIPNVLTPNDDGVNDIFQLNFSFKTTSILNRCGNLIWTGSDGEYWNGKTQDGQNVSEGTYFYIIETDTEKYQGFVQVVRNKVSKKNE